MQAMCEDFMACKGAWEKSTLFRRITSSKKNKKRGCRKWLTKSQLLEHFKDPKIVAAIIHRKMNDKILRKNEVRWHPEVPSHLALTLCRKLLNDCAMLIVPA